jgi:hypothetical protein
MIEATSGEVFELTPVEMTEPVRAEIIEPARRDAESQEPYDIIELEEIPADSIHSIQVSPSAPEPTAEVEFEFEYGYEPRSEPVYTPPEVDDEETIISPALPQEQPVYEAAPEEPVIGVQTESGLMLTLLDDEEFVSGAERTLRVLVSYRSGDYDKPLANVPLSVKILGTTFRPLIYSLKTERDGVATVATQIPHFTSGRAAVLVKVSTKGEAAELRRVIHPAR